MKRSLKRGGGETSTQKLYLHRIAVSLNYGGKNIWFNIFANSLSQEPFTKETLNSISGRDTYSFPIYFKTTIDDVDVICIKATFGEQNYNNRNILTLYYHLENSYDIKSEKILVGYSLYDSIIEI